MAYYYMALVHTIVILGSALVKVYLGQLSQKKIKSMAEFTTTVEVLRDGTWSTIGSEQLVPGKEQHSVFILNPFEFILRGCVQCEGSNSSLL
jgi:hypothetical protein